MFGTNKSAEREGTVPPSITRSFFFALSFNIRFVSELLEVLLGEFNTASDAGCGIAKLLSSSVCGKTSTKSPCLLLWFRMGEVLLCCLSWTMDEERWYC